MNCFTPKEVCANSLSTFQAKAALSISRMACLGFLAGAYIAFGAEAATMITHDLSIQGISRLVSGMIFSTGLMLVLIAGGELFTGNILMWMGVVDGSVKPLAMLRNWLWVYLANFAGSLAVVYLMYYSGLWSFNNSLVGASVIKIAWGKVGLSFGAALVRGILCNWLVCLAVWMAYASKDVIGKIVGIFFPITLFVASNFEHSIANMYYVPAGILALRNPAAVAASHLAGKTDVLNWRNFLVANLLPVTIGNILGAALFVAFFYWFAYLRQSDLAQVLPKSAPVLAAPCKALETQPAGSGD